MINFTDVRSWVSDLVWNVETFVRLYTRGYVGVHKACSGGVPSVTNDERYGAVEQSPL